ncbi:YlbD family protein [Texcoconibacillus texcoconensis]|uniref:Coat protein n=1 Tax=Texcoconibacillus texcoconensis TaxID=1095777 RepID=A0A840QLF7_9BACI|nr:YlbD family protein [Texcoconibacillus texcoconensis]MBB5172204.1 hypothetical protein [Texcoconibacillus texcoconensis]
MGKSLHPSVRKFKEFVKNHPNVLQDVKNGDKTLQDLYEEWMILGDNDPIWEKYKRNEQPQNDDGVDQEENEEDEEGEEDKDDSDDEKNKQDLQDLLGMMKNINLNDVQSHLEQIGGIVTSIQGIVDQFRQGSSSSSSQSNTTNTNSSSQSQSPFSFQRD